MVASVWGHVWSTSRALLQDHHHGSQIPQDPGQVLQTRFNDDALSYLWTIFQVMSWYSTSEEEASQRMSNDIPP